MIRAGENKRITIGKLGEKIARRYLKRRGYRIIEQNYRNRYAEIDLVAFHRMVLVFVEVRTKSSEDFGSPEDTLNKRKINKVAKNAFYYVSEKGYQKGYRIDAVCVVLSRRRKPLRITHYQDITW